MLNGAERFFIEKIRVNVKLNFLGFHPTQAEIISTLIFLTGAVLWIVLYRKAMAQKSTSGNG
jgi:prolipoprotein diacylglyceryltransferase